MRIEFRKIPSTPKSPRPASPWVRKHNPPLDPVAARVTQMADAIRNSPQVVIVPMPGDPPPRRSALDKV